MGTIRASNLIGRRNLVGASSVTVSVNWEADHSDDLSMIGNREAKQIVLQVDGPYAPFTRAFDIEHAEILYDLLHEAILSTKINAPTSEPSS